MKYLYQREDWPNWRWDAAVVAGPLAELSLTVGKFVGRLSSLGFAMQQNAVHEMLSTEILASAAIEGERLNREDVRSSVAKRMELVLSAPAAATTHATEARVDMLLDATRRWREPMTLQRLCAWHAALFPTGYSGMTQIAVARLRDDEQGAMQVISRHGMLERVHFTAPSATVLPKEMVRFLAWVNEEASDMPWLVKTALAHLWFLTLHPFDDGNGRLARALTEYLLAKGEQSELRFYSLSAQIQQEKPDYYNELERAQRGGMDVTRWIAWFLGCHLRAIQSAETRLAGLLAKADFWREYAQAPFSATQRKIINLLFDGFEGHLTTSKLAKICKVSQDTALREISALVAQGVLRQVGQGRSTHYILRSASEDPAK